MLKFPIREMKKRSEREMGLTQIGREVKLDIPLFFFLFRTDKTYIFLILEREEGSWVFLFSSYTALLLDH